MSNGAGTTIMGGCCGLIVWLFVWACLIAFGAFIVKSVMGW